MNHLGEQPASLDFWMDVKRRKTWNADSDQLLEDRSVEELRESAVRRLPAGVKSIRTTFFFRPEVLQNLEGVLQNLPSSSRVLNRLTNTAGFAASLNNMTPAKKEHRLTNTAGLAPNNVVHNTSFPPHQNVTPAKKEQRNTAGLAAASSNMTRILEPAASRAVQPSENVYVDYPFFSTLEPAAKTDFNIGTNFVRRPGLSICDEDPNHVQDMLLQCSSPSRVIPPCLSLSPPLLSLSFHSVHLLHPILYPLPSSFYTPPPLMLYNSLPPCSTPLIVHLPPPHSG